jgi:hypothetical protein
MRNQVVRHIAIGAAATACIFLGATVASAQAGPAAHTWARGTTLEVIGGAATASPGTSGIYGAAVGWELNHLAEIEGVAAWLPERKGTQAFAADLKLLVNLTRPALLVPYVGGGAGLYRGTFDTARVTMPHFYRQRQNAVEPTGLASFTDPTVVVAAGANLYLARHFSLRPELGLRIVTNGSDTYRVTALTFALAYHVEEHAVGNSRK